MWGGGDNGGGSNHSFNMQRTMFAAYVKVAKEENRSRSSVFSCDIWSASAIERESNVRSLC